MTTTSPSATNPVTNPIASTATAARTSIPVAAQVALLLSWQGRRSLPMLPLLVVVQGLMAVAAVIGYGLIIGDPDPTASLYLATGAPAITLVMLGLVMTPQLVSQSRTEGSLDWMRTLPVARGSFLLADLLLWSLLALPGLVLGVLVGAARLDVELSPAWWLLPGSLLVSGTAACIGYATATVLPPPVAQVVSQVLVFVIMLFSPISFPAGRLPQWAQDLHQWLPFEQMALVVRAGLCSDQVSMPLRSWAVLTAWALVSVAGAMWALRRRA